MAVDTTDAYEGPTGDLIDASAERDQIRMALNSALEFEYYAPGDRDFWGIFWESLERHAGRIRVDGQTSLDEWR